MAGKVLIFKMIFFFLSQGLQAEGQNIIFTDGEYINQIAACKDVSTLFSYN